MSLNLDRVWELGYGDKQLKSSRDVLGDEHLWSGSISGAQLTNKKTLHSLKIKVAEFKSQKPGNENMMFLITP